MTGRFDFKIPREAKKGDTIAIEVTPKTLAFTVALHHKDSGRLELISQESGIVDGKIQLRLQKGKIINTLKKGHYTITAWAADEKTGQGNRIRSPFEII